jgi:phosphorylase/glycogen(starch) synthase
MKYPDYLFETSWEVCNKVGGIHTVVSTKAKTLVGKLNSNLILIGPDIRKENMENQEFEEDYSLFKSWKSYAQSKGLKIRIGKWKIIGEPIVVLVDFSQYFSQKDDIFSDFWEEYGLDSITGGWDYIEPCLFGYASAKVIENFYEFYAEAKDKIVAQFHEWMTGSGILYLKKHCPQIATAFTTHASVLGRCLAGNNMSLYSSLQYYEGENIANQFNMRAKYSMEKLSALNADVFTTVSEITNNECKQFFKKSADVITPNGFENDFVPQANEYKEISNNARKKIIEIAQKLTSTTILQDAFLIINSGRYEFKNKGIDVFIKALGEVNKSKIEKDVVAVIAVPAYNVDSQKDAILNEIKANNLNNSQEDKVKIIFIPSYLDGKDGLVNIAYFDFLTGFDLSIFPSYYEPWGYTPMESLAFGVPSITTSLAGFGLWMKNGKYDIDKALSVIERTDENTEEVISKIKTTIEEFLKNDSKESQNLKAKAMNLSLSVLWKNLIDNYLQAYNIALSKAETRKEQYSHKQACCEEFKNKINWGESPNWKKIFVKQKMPSKLEFLQTLSKNIWWTWNSEAYELFEYIDKEKFLKYERSPIHLLESLSQEEIENLLKDEIFLEKIDKVEQVFNSYMQKAERKEGDMIAYLSMEFGLHDTLKIFSGGLGMLAGDYLKQASDSNKNMIGIGLLYRNGYFTQQITKEGYQISAQYPQKFTHLPLQAEKDENGLWRKITLAFPGRNIYAKIWRCDVGRVPLYLLDTDIEENNQEDRAISNQLYGGDWENRLKQEILLGIGGVRLVEELNLPVVLYHNNEGHSAFSSLERMRTYIQKHSYSFKQAQELVRSSTLFTTHTPVPAGHDTFSEELLRTYLGHFAEQLNLNWNEFFALGKEGNNKDSKFSMSVLAINFSQYVNGVSKIHARVSRDMFSYLYKGYFPRELHINHVTNGVHHSTWASKAWLELYKEGWENIYNVEDSLVWNTHLNEKKTLIEFVKNRLQQDFTKRAENPKLYFQTTAELSEEKFIVGFARRFATYKRANLLFTNLERLKQIVDCGVVFIFAGKAHPQDGAGQGLIKRIIEISKMPEFIGKIIFLENYDMYMAKHLIRGVDLWLNMPTRPLEASGTSGEKAVMNGVVNFSVLDGWWAEGYNAKAGWALSEEQTYESHEYQNTLDSEMIYNIFENEIIPCYNYKDQNGIRVKWVERIKHTIALIAPHFTMKRQLDDYYEKFYNEMFKRFSQLNAQNAHLAKEYAEWKNKITHLWNAIELLDVTIPDIANTNIELNDIFTAKVSLYLGDISPEHIGIEMIIADKENNQINDYTLIAPFEQVCVDNKRADYEIKIKTSRAGVHNFAFRIYPKHPLMQHRMELPLIKWI